MQLHRTIVRSARTLTVATGLLAAACSSEGGAQTKEETKQSAAALSTATATIHMPVPPNWIGAQLGIPAPTLTPIGHVNVVPMAPDWRPMDSVYNPTKTDPPSSTDSQLVRLASDGTIYQLNLTGEHMQHIGAYFKDHGLNGSSQPGQSANVPKGFPNGQDDRTYWPYNPSGDFPRTPIGTIGSINNCSATMFSSRLVITAQHCWWNGTNTFTWPSQFRPGVDRNYTPFAGVGVQAVWWDSAWYTNGCGAAGAPNNLCNTWDWAIFELNSPIPGAGYMGFAYGTVPQLQSWLLLTAGYPACNDVGSPSGCVYPSNYRSNGRTGMQVGPFFNPFNGCNGGVCENNWDRSFWSGYSISPGDSGSPWFSWSPGSNGPYVVGVVGGETCDGPPNVNGGCQVGNTTPNISLALDPVLFNRMSTLKSSMP